MIYLDHHAACPTPDAVRQAMAEARAIAWANPSSTHQAGRASRRFLEQARTAIAKTVGAQPADLVLTAGGTEACNLGIRGLGTDCQRIVTTDTEHPAVQRSIEHLERLGADVIRLPMLEGRIPGADQLNAHLEPGALVAIQWVNHETGTVFPIADYATACRARDAKLFVDATQALGKLPIDVERLGVDALAIAAQKIGGPSGAGACWVRRGVDVEPVLDGGSQERGRRPGTQDTASVVGFAAACGSVPARLEAQAALGTLRDRIERGLTELGAVRNGVGKRAATVANVSFRGWDGAVLVAALDLEGVCVSTGAACSSGLQQPSAVIAAMYPDEQWRARSAVRISLGLETTEAEIEKGFQAFRRVLLRGGGKT